MPVFHNESRETNFDKKNQTQIGAENAYYCRNCFQKVPEKFDYKSILDPIEREKSDFLLKSEFQIRYQKKII